MIVNRDINTTLESNIEETSSFTVKASGKAFKVLSSNLYKDKHASILRELVSNALDSHKQANQNKDVLVLLPTVLEPNLRIVDYGVGMSQDDVKSVYTQLFASTKDQSEDFIGGFGLGSKTPFSISSGFFIASIKDNIKTDYFMFLEEGIPSYSITNSEHTEDSNGVTISIPCTEVDIQLFNKSIFQVSCMMGVHIEGYTRTKEIQDIHDCIKNMDMSKEEVYFLQSDTYSRVANVLVCVGGVIYDNLQHNTTHNIIAYAPNIAFPYARILLNIPIAQAYVTASREDLDTVHDVAYFETTFKSIIEQKQREEVYKYLEIDKDLSEYTYDQLDEITLAIIKKKQRTVNLYYINRILLEAIDYKAPISQNAVVASILKDFSNLYRPPVVIYSEEDGCIPVTPKTISRILGSVDSRDSVVVANTADITSLRKNLEEVYSDKMDMLLERTKAKYFVGVDSYNLNRFRATGLYKIRATSINDAFFKPKKIKQFSTVKSVKSEVTWEIVKYVKENDTARNYVIASEKGFKNNIHQLVGKYYSFNSDGLYALKYGSFVKLPDPNYTINFSAKQLKWLKDEGLSDSFNLEAYYKNIRETLVTLPYVKIILVAYTVLNRLDYLCTYRDILSDLGLESYTALSIATSPYEYTLEKLEEIGIDLSPFITKEGIIKVDTLVLFMYYIESLKPLFKVSYTKNYEDLPPPISAFKQDIIHKLKEIKNELYSS